MTNSSYKDTGVGVISYGINPWCIPDDDALQINQAQNIVVTEKDSKNFKQTKPYS